MWEKFDGAPYTREEFADMVEAIPAAKLKWVKFLTLHHTAAPSIKQWLGPTSAKQRILNMQNYYEKQCGWRAGPHSFIPPDRDICHWGFTPFDTPGVHASCFNRVSIGLEMIGDFHNEEFHSGAGAIVRDHTVYVLAVLHNKLGLRPDNFKLGERGLHFHTDCRRDGKICPGSKVTKEYMVTAVLAEMERLKAAKLRPLPAPVIADTQTDETHEAFEIAPPPPTLVKTPAAAPDSSPLSRVTTATSSMAALNALAAEGSRLAAVVKKIKQWFWTAMGGGAALSGVANQTLDPNVGSAAVVNAWVQQHPYLFGILVGVTLTTLFYVGIKLVERYILTAARDGRYQPQPKEIQ